ncbi:bacterial regulatory helix-turn-helix, lysR family protein [Burkholderia gladioli]|uniref:Bacterial regulatory helix-turn-helix, lysR family protein n=1 Tax=Burkholderia gladioli TaxID=28095 RepID=A0AAW3ESR9_BURGA|nr:LysR family transcriptional regulator [Burkholderia gladioli]AJX00930.1 bacterial regulatory helix-turn-helix, lysR family protein [Burkholderia gladioli]ASD78653.1 transcriptional regulator [Burkholderia gladioli pv. gladioli]AWY56103.1 transcriptional regulator [Burkholderia gladioli pv. gladioli]KGC09814.1 bacterial regulatory helix-turn-helix, lysR family protein [Burkholderia gladioli]SPV11124.1 LysR family transcriptional regulator [Burkholderia gladioli]
MELRHLRYFLAIAEESNVTRAAERLGIGQPPLSQQIRNLERELGVELFRRTAHGVVLTSAGQAFRVEAARVLDDAARARRAAQQAGNGETGILRLGFTASAVFNPVVPALIQRFKAAYPGVDVSLDEANTPELVRRLADERLDAVFVRPCPTSFEGLALRPFPDEPMKLVVPASHRFAQRRRVALAELADEAFVLVPGPAGATLYAEILDACRRAGFLPRLAQEAPQISSVINLVAAGLGLSIVPAAFEQVRVQGVRYLDIDGVPAVARLALATREREREQVVANLMALL